MLNPFPPSSSCEPLYANNGYASATSLIGDRDQQNKKEVRSEGGYRRGRPLMRYGLAEWCTLELDEPPCMTKLLRGVDGKPPVGV